MLCVLIETIAGLLAKITSFGARNLKIDANGRKADRMVYKLHKTIVLVGMMGAGKSAVGKALAAELGVDFIDSDAEIEIAANTTIAEIFAQHGEAFFRDKERQVIARLLDGVPAVLSVGGGAFLDAQTRNVIAAQGVSLWLDADLDLLWSRVKHRDTRPLLRTADPRATLEDLFNARKDTYALSQLRVKAKPEYAIEDMCAKVIETLAADPKILKVSA